MGGGPGGAKKAETSKKFQKFDRRRKLKREYSKCLKSKLIRISDSSVVSHSQTSDIRQRPKTERPKSKHQKAKKIMTLKFQNYQDFWTKKFGIADVEVA